MRWDSRGLLTFLLMTSVVIMVIGGATIQISDLQGRLEAAQDHENQLKNELEDVQEQHQDVQKHLATLAVHNIRADGYALSDPLNQNLTEGEWQLMMARTGFSLILSRDLIEPLHDEPLSAALNVTIHALELLQPAHFHEMIVDSKIAGLAAALGRPLTEIQQFPAEIARLNSIYVNATSVTDDVERLISAGSDLSRVARVDADTSGLEVQFRGRVPKQLPQSWVVEVCGVVNGTLGACTVSHNSILTDVANPASNATASGDVLTITDEVAQTHRTILIVVRSSLGGVTAEDALLCDLEGGECNDQEFDSGDTFHSLPVVLAAELSTDS